MVEYYPEAVDFARRAGVPIGDGDALALTRLWAEADGLDARVMGRLGELNDGLLGGKGTVDALRGASQRETAAALIGDGGAVGGGDGDAAAALGAFFDCSWTLEWGDGRCVSVALEVDAGAGVFYAYARGAASGAAARVGYPVTDGALEEALTEVFVAEVAAAVAAGGGGVGDLAGV